jgi:phosphate transport system substrate-binding protein
LSLEVIQEPTWRGLLAVCAAAFIVGLTVGWIVWFSPAVKKISAEAKPKEVRIRLHGSTTVGAALAPALAQGFLHQKNATNIIGDQKSSLDSVRTIAGDIGTGQDRIHLSFEIKARGTGQGFTDLGARGPDADQCDIALASRKIKVDDLLDLSALGDLASRDGEYLVGLDGLAIIVNPNNPLKWLTKQQVGKIFTGEIERWEDIPAVQWKSARRTGRIEVFARAVKEEARSGTLDSFVDMVLKDRSLGLRCQSQRDGCEVKSYSTFPNNFSISQNIVQAPRENAIAFVDYADIGKAATVEVSAGGATPLGPNPESIRNEDYPLTRRLYMYVPIFGVEPSTRAFADYVRGQGQTIVDANGFVSQTISVATKAGNERLFEECPNRLSMTINFRTGQSDFDSRTWYEFVRLRDYWQTIKNPSQTKLCVAGFTDASGDNSTNVQLSKERAELVAKLLWDLKLKPAPLAIIPAPFGAGHAIDTNETLEGRERNRRVEIWILSVD